MSLEELLRTIHADRNSIIGNDLEFGSCTFSRSWALTTAYSPQWYYLIDDRMESKVRYCA